MRRSATPSDPLLAQLKGEYRTVVRQRAGARPIASWVPRTAPCCASRFVDQLSIDEIGAAFGVHRATAARWLQRAAAPWSPPRAAGSPARLKLSVDEVDSVIRLVQSQLDASVIRYLRDSDD